MKPRLAILGGEIADGGVYRSLAVLATHFELRGLTLCPDIGAERISYKIETYQPNSDLAGLYPAIASELLNFDVLLCVEGARLHSLQVLKLARQLRKPLWLYSSEYKRGLYERFSAIQKSLTSLIGYSTHHFVPHKQCVEFLKDYGDITSRGVSVLPYQGVSPHAEQLVRFRSHMGWEKKQRVCLHYGPMSTENSAVVLLRAFALIKLEHPRFRLPKLVLAGQEERGSKLKHLAFKLGVGGECLFIHKDIGKLSTDLFCASDVVFFSTRDENGFPSKLVEIGSCGALSVAVEPETEYARMIGSLAGCVVAQDPRALAELLLAVFKVKDSSLCSLLRQQQQRLSALATDAKQLEASVVRLAEQSSDLCDPNKKESLAPENYLDEGALGRSQILMRKGQQLYELDLTEDAIDALEQSLAYDQDNEDAYLLLGKIAAECCSLRESLTFYKRALAINPARSEACFGIGQLLFKSHQGFESLSWLERGLTLATNLERRHLSFFTGLCLELDDPKIAVASLERVIDLQGPDPQLLLTLGQLLVRIPERRSEGETLLATLA